MMVLGDMMLMTEHPQPVTMMKALAAISLGAHAAYDKCSGFAPGTSHDKCLFMSLAVRDFLVQIGFTDATVRGCFLYICADDLDGKQLWSVGTGAPGQPALGDGKFNGHAVVVIPSLSLLVDVTVYQAIRPQWNHAVSGMVALPYHEPWQRQAILGCPSIAGVEVELTDRRVCMLWLDRPELQWKRALDYRVKSDRRKCVTAALKALLG